MMISRPLLADHDLDAAVAFTSLALFDILQFPLSMFPIVVNNIAEARVRVLHWSLLLLKDGSALLAICLQQVSVNRIQEFLELNEIQSKKMVDMGNYECSIVIVNGNFFWDDLRTRAALNSINMQVIAGSFVVVSFVACLWLPQS